MSELKAYIGPYPSDHTITEYYFKSEADKVIAEKDAEIAELKEQIEVLKHQACKMDCMMVKHYNEVCDDNIHQKYKRCLAMAKACKEKGERMYCEASTAKSLNEIIGKEPNDAVVKKFELWGTIACTHCKRWLKLADKFKEVK